MYIGVISPTRIVVMHEDPLITEGLLATFSASPHLTVVNPNRPWPERPSGGEADVIATDHVQALAWLRQPDRSRSPGDCAPTSPARIMVVTQQTGEHQVNKAVQAGVHGYVLIGSPLEEYVEAARVLGRGARYICRTASQNLMGSLSQASLTTRENDVLGLLAQGLANKSIANALGISVGTVKVHVRSILEKLEASSRTQAASVAAQRGLIDAHHSSQYVMPPRSRPIASAQLLHTT